MISWGVSVCAMRVYRRWQFFRWEDVGWWDGVAVGDRYWSAAAHSDTGALLMATQRRAAIAYLAESLPNHRLPRASPRFIGYMLQKVYRILPGIDGGSMASGVLEKKNWRNHSSRQTGGNRRR